MSKSVYDKAIREAGKRLPFKTRKQQNEILEFAADDLADAYRIGAEEAQHEILTRLRNLAEREKQTTSAADSSVGAKPSRMRRT